MSVAAPVAVSGGGLGVSAPTMMIKETSLRRDPDLRGELAFLARGCDFVLPSRFKKRLKSFQQQQVSRCGEQHGQGASVWTGTEVETDTKYIALVPQCESPPLLCTFTHVYVHLLDASDIKHTHSKCI